MSGSMHEVTRQDAALFAPLIGQIAWHAQADVDHWLTIEFGDPHLAVRDPVAMKLSHADKVQKSLSRRRVFLVGHWHFWVQEARWKLRCSQRSIGTDGVWRDAAASECFDELQGQKLVSAAIGSHAHSWVLKFDLGAILELEPEPDAAPESDQWTLHAWDGDVIGYQNDGRWTVEKAS